MAMNKQKGNMYGFVTHTWNPIKGKCSHDCKYCYMKIWKQNLLHLVAKELNDNLGEGNFIFVGSSTDMFADDVPSEWIKKVLAKCRKHKNKYLFQTKNPIRFEEFKGYFPENSVYGITLESDKTYELVNAPQPEKRFSDMMVFQTYYFVKETMVTIEPIMDFHMDDFIFMLKELNPTWVNIGADSKNHNLPEPSKEKIEALIEELKKFTEVKIKKTLSRLTDMKIKKEGK